jgi:2-oxoglutarate/2-oxoacid ferredoxin oxidoreductase subunit alpha
MLETASDSAEKKGLSKSTKPIVRLTEHIVEIVSDSGEGAQRCGQSFAAIAARSGNGIWTVEIIPAEIQPPARSIEGTSGNRIRVSSNTVTNGGDEADLVIAFNEQVLLSRINAHEIKPGCIILLEDKWATHPDASIVTAYTETRDRLLSDGYNILEIPMEVECLKHVPDAKRGKNMFVLGMLCSIYSMDLEIGRQQVARIFAKKSDAIINANQILLEAGHDWAADNLKIKYQIPAVRKSTPQIVVNGNTALSLGVLASGMQICAMYPITPATSASHYLSDVFNKVGGLVHQAEDEIAACAFAVGASYAGKCAVTITSGPGYSLKQEAIGLAVMGEIPMVVVNVQRGGPSTGQPTKVEQGDLLTACFGSHGDAPKVVMAAANIEDCFYSMITARQLAETFNMVVVVLTDANLATAQQPIPRPEFSEEWLAPPIDQSAVPKDAKPYDWDPKTGIAPRFIPGRPGGMHCLTGLAHDENSKVIYDPEINEQAIEKRSLKLAALQKTLKPPQVFGEDHGDLLIIGWGSTKGAIEEAIERVRADGLKASSIHLQFLQPMASGLKEIMAKFDKIIVVENSWSDKLEDEMIDENNRRYSNLAWLLRGRYLVDADCWSEVKGRPSKPGAIEQMIRDRLQ